jgi:hypothetical protein
VLVPKRSDSRLGSTAARSYYDELVGAGVTIHEYGPSMPHAKLLVVDERIAAVGSANFDNRSLALNFAAMAVLYDAGLAGQLARSFTAHLRHANRCRASALPWVSGWANPLPGCYRRCCDGACQSRENQYRSSGGQDRRAPASTFSFSTSRVGRGHAFRMDCTTVASGMAKNTPQNPQRPPNTSTATIMAIGCRSTTSENSSGTNTLPSSP